MNDENKTPVPADPNGQPQPVSPPAAPASHPDALPQSPLNQPAPIANPAAAPPSDTFPIPDAQAQASTPAQPMPQTLNEITQANPAGTQAEAPNALGSIAHGFTTVFAAIFSWIIFPLAVVLILHNFVFQAYHVLGTSMFPTLHDSDYLIVSKVGYSEALIGRLFGKNDQYLPSRGQIIVFHYPKDPTKIFIKRVVGLPGERVVVKNGAVTVFNQAHPSGFNPDAKYEPSGTTTLIDTDEVVQPDNLFVMGDNRTPGGSYDSREWGELPSSYIIGDAVLRLLPLNSVKVL